VLAGKEHEREQIMFMKKSREYSYIRVTNREHYTPTNCTRREKRCVQNAIITNADCIFGYKNIGTDNQRCNFTAK